MPTQNTSPPQPLSVNPGSEKTDGDHPLSMAFPPEIPQAIRLNKVLAQAGVCSRRAADALILAGEVAVNGVVVISLGTRIDPSVDRIQVHGRHIPLPSRDAGEQQALKAHLYLAVHKPPGVVTTAHDPQGRQTVLDLLPIGLRKRRPVPVGRLDLPSEGLLLLTTDGEMTLRMTHPRWEHPKTYHVRVRGRVTEEKLRAMRDGMRLAEGECLAPVAVRVIAALSPRSTDNGVTLKMAKVFKISQSYGNVNISTRSLMIIFLYRLIQ